MAHFDCDDTYIEGLESIIGRALTALKIARIYVNIQPASDKKTQALEIINAAIKECKR